MMGAIGIELTNGWWRVRWFPYSLGGETAKQQMREWCKINAQGDWKIFTSHMRFRDESDALMCYIAFAGK